MNKDSDSGRVAGDDDASWRSGNLGKPGLRLLAAPGWFARRRLSRPRRAAPNRSSRSGPRPHSGRRLRPAKGRASETSPCRRTGNAKRCARPPKG